MLYDNLSVNEAGHLVFAGYDTAELAKEYAVWYSDELPVDLLADDHVEKRGEDRVAVQLTGEIWHVLIPFVL